MARPDLAAIPEFYHKYVGLVLEDSAVDALTNGSEEALILLRGIQAGHWHFRYAEGKWSISEMVQHMIDTERIFAYRALCFARQEKAGLPGFDENSYANCSEADRRTKDELLNEFDSVRQSTTLLFRSFSEQQLNGTGIANNKPVGVNSVGFIAAGHVRHHLNILRERYLINL